MLLAINLLEVNSVFVLDLYCPLSIYPIFANRILFDLSTSQYYFCVIPSFLSTLFGNLILSPFGSTGMDQLLLIAHLAFKMLSLSLLSY